MVDRSEPAALSAGAFGSWLRELARSRSGGAGMAVPCGDCNACCRSSYFIHVEPDERETLARIPRELLFPAPGLPQGHMVLGYDERGHCPMLREGRCTIYEHRPRTCRRFDCRIFAASGVAAGGGGESPVDRQVRRWRFQYSAAGDEERHAAVVAAAGFLREHAGQLPGNLQAARPAVLALLAIEVHELFLPGAARVPEADLLEAVRGHLGERQA